MSQIIVVVGPTGVGKTEIGVLLAQKFHGEIINADSRQVYQDLVIGTSSPPEEFFKKIPHHLFGVSRLDDPWDAARFQKEADRLIASMAGRNYLPFVVGGTGLYVKALLYGLFTGPRAEREIRSALEARKEAEGLRALYQELESVDPQAAREIHPNDCVRIIRALEVYRITGKPISAHQKEHRFEKRRYDYFKIGIKMDREGLIQRIDGRVAEMIGKGLEEEVRELYQKWPGNFLLAHAIGYKEWVPYLEEKTTQEKVIEEIKINTRQFARRQMTWFRKEKDIVWFDAEDLEGMEGKVQDFLDGS